MQRLPRAQAKKPSERHFSANYLHFRAPFEESSQALLTDNASFSALRAAKDVLIDFGVAYFPCGIHSEN